MKKKLILGIVVLVGMFADFASLSQQTEKKIRIIIVNKQKYISMYDFSASMDIHNSYDIITGRGKILYKGNVAVYQTGFCVSLLNGRLVNSDYPVAKIRGEILLPVKIFRSIILDFYPDYNISERDSELILDPGRKAVSRPEKKTGDSIDFIIIDPGHGGMDPGAIGKAGEKEKQITLNVSLYLEEFLKSKEEKIKIILTRRADKFIELGRRTEIANSMLSGGRNGIFVSVHVNASILHSISGFETYFLSQNPSNEDARTTAALENHVVVLEENKKGNKYSDVEHVEALMLNTQIQKDSSSLANLIQKSINVYIDESHSNGVKKADFFVLRGSLMPAVLIELGYISNAKELKNLQSRKYQKELAEGIGEGIIKFIGKYNKVPQ